MTSEQLRKARILMGYTQKELAAELNTPVGTYQKWELGKRRVPGVCQVAINHLVGLKRLEQEEILCYQFYRDLLLKD